jgi:formate dehydrogenase maturation protein FdhE
MAQCVPEPGQLESLAQRSNPHVRFADCRTIFERRAAQLQKPAIASLIDGYLEVLASLADPQTETASLVGENPPDPILLKRSCEHGMPHCRKYRQILYEEQDPGVDAVADDLGVLASDLLLNKRGYQRASENPLLITPASR